MPRDLFGHVTRPSISIGSRKWYTVPLSLISHAAIVLVLIAIPILAPSVMPSVFANDDLVVIHAIMPPPPPPPIIRPEATPPPPPVDPGAAPVVAPDGIHDEKPLPELSETVSPSLILGDVSGTEVLQPPPPQPPPAQTLAPVRPGGQVRTPIKTYHVDPVYSPIAQAAGVQGIVIIEATISETGVVTNARVLRSVPLLDQAAINAVREWQYTPTQLNGRPVPVIMTVTVHFTLRR